MLHLHLVYIHKFVLRSSMCRLEMHNITMDRISVKEYSDPFSKAEKLTYKQAKGKREK